MRRLWIVVAFIVVLLVVIKLSSTNAADESMYQTGLVLADPKLTTEVKRIAEAKTNELQELKRQNALLDHQNRLLDDQNKILRHQQEDFQKNLSSLTASIDRLTKELANRNLSQKNPNQ